MLFVAAPNAHTYRLLIFKDRCLVLLAEEAFCSSAKRQDYEAFRTSRQALLFLANFVFAYIVSRGTES
jgi:hypothetical protein